MYIPEVMAEGRGYALGAQLDIEQILSEAHHRWLRPAEICEILRNYTKFGIATEPGNRPSNGSLFLFDRKVLRYFRKDGHNWRKTKDGKTVKESHERLKDGSIDVLQCYYAHGEGNENFQRRSYWLLEEQLSNIVLVHYREVKGKRTRANRIKEVTLNSLESEGNRSACEVDSSLSSKFHTYNYPVASQTTNNSTYNYPAASQSTDKYEDAESAYSQQSTSKFSPVLNLQPSITANTDDLISMPYYHVSSSNDKDENFQANPDMSFVSLMQGEKDGNNLDAGFTCAFEGYSAGNQSTSNHSTRLSTDPSMCQPDAEYNNNLASRLHEDVNFAEIFNSFETTSTIDQHKLLAQGSFEFHLADEDGGKPNLQGNVDSFIDEKSGYLNPLYLMKEGRKKLESFDRWLTKELGDVKESQTQATSGTYCREAVESEKGVDESIISPQVHLDSYVLGQSLFQDLLFNITDFSPNWAYAGYEIKVIVRGRFLRSQQELEHCEWACMFGELEVPAQVVADGVLCCHTPDHKPGRVHFYVTCSNRLACSEVREFEFQVNKHNTVGKIEL